MAYQYDLATTPIISAMLATGDTVTATVYDRSTGSAVSLSANSATEQPSGSGRYKYTFAFTTPPTYGSHSYDVKLTGALQTRWVSVDWNSDDAKYKGVVYIDTTGLGTAGTAYPIGTDFKPVSNLADAKTILARINSKTIKLHGTLTLATSVAGYTFQGVGAKETTLITLGSQDVTGTVFENLHLTGTSGGQLFYAYNCWMHDITNLNCHGEFIKFYGAFVIQTGGSFLISNAKATGSDFVTFDMGGASGLGLAECDAFLSVSNSSNIASMVVIAGNHNTVIQSNFTAGTVVLIGIGTPTILGTPTTYLNQTTPDAFFAQALSRYTSAGTAGNALASITFNSCVWIDTTSIHSGTTYPIGTQLMPVNNITDAKAIATIWGIRQYNITGNITLDAAHPNWIFNGNSGASNSYITLNSQNVQGSVFNDCALLDYCVGSIYCKNTAMVAVSNIDGSFQDTYMILGFDFAAGFTGGFTRGYFISTSFDLTGISSVAVTEMSGGLTITNLTSGTFYRSGIGITTIAASCTGGTITIEGEGRVVDNSNGATVVDRTTINMMFNEPLSIHTTPGVSGNSMALSSFGGYIWIDTSSGYSGSTYPTGTQQQPVNNITDAKAIYAIWNIKQYKVKGNITLNSAHAGWVFEGSEGATNSIINLDNQNVAGAIFKQCTLLGQCNGLINAIECNMSNVTDVNGFFLNTSLAGNFTLKTGISVGFLNGYIVPGTTIDMNGSTSLTFSNYDGDVTISNLNTGKTFYRSGTGKTIFDTTCQYGTATVEGEGRTEIITGAHITLNDNTISTQITNVDTDVNSIPDSIMQYVTEGTLTLQQVMRILLAIQAGKTSITDLGGGNATVKFRDTTDAKDRVTATMTGSKRTGITVDVS